MAELGRDELQRRPLERGSRRKPVPIYSHTQLSTFEQCPHRYKLKYVDKVQKPKEKGIEAFLGSRVHEVLQKLYDDLKYEKLNTLEELLDYYHGRWSGNWGPGIKIVRKDLTGDNYRDYGARCIRNYYQRHYPFQESQTLSTELHLVFPLDAAGCYKFQGYIDRLARRADGTYEIHDYKTAASLPEQAQVDADRQLSLYQIGLQAKWRRVDRVELIWHYVGLDSELTSRRTPEQLRELSGSAIRLIDRIEACGRFPAVKSRLCDWCEYRPECPLWKHVLAVQSLPPEALPAEAGARLAGEYADTREKIEKLERRLEELRDKILQFARQEGVAVIQGPGVRLSISCRTQWFLPVQGERARNELESFVRSVEQWDEVSDLSVNRLTKILEDEAWPEEWLHRVRSLLRTRQIHGIRVSRSEDSGPL